jgi:hypothetical protein
MLGGKMREPLDRETFLALIQTKSTTLAQRQHTGEAAFAFGLTKPPHINEYQYLDAAAAILASMLNLWARLELKHAAEIVRTHWDDWLTLLIRAESDPRTAQFVAVIRTSLDPAAPPHIAMGDAAHVGKVAPPSERPAFMIPMSFLLRCLRENARRAGIDLPNRLTVDPADKAAYAKWRAEIDTYREAAGARRAKAKLTLA